MMFSFSILRRLAMVIMVITLSAPHAFGATGTLELVNPAQIECGQPFTFAIRASFTDSAGSYVRGISNGFRIYSPDGATWTPIVGEFDPSIDWGSYFDFGIFVNLFGVDGTSDDTIGFAAVSGLAPGLSDGFDSSFVLIHTQVSCSDTGKTICIDSTWYPPSNTWVWSMTAGGIVPDWGGPYCLTIVENYEDSVCYADGDINGDGTPLTIVDVIYLANFLDGTGPAPDSLWWGDMNGDGYLDELDVEKLSCYFVSGFSCFPEYPVPTNCLPDTLRGASCVDGTCLILSEANCLDTGGTYYGDGTFCEDFECQSDTVTIFGLQHVSTGAANFDTSGGALTVSNIGSSGEDGVVIDFDGPVTSWAADFSSLPPIDSLVEGYMLKFTGIGMVDSVIDKECAILIFDKRFPPNGPTVTPDFSNVGSSTYVIEIFREGELVAILPGQSGPACIIPIWPDSFEDWIRRWLEDWLVSVIRFETPVPIQVIGDSTYVGDEVCFMAENPIPDGTILTSMIINAKELGSFTISDEKVNRNMLTSGELHNEAIDYFLAHNPLNGNEARISLNDYRNILDTLAEFTIVAGFDSSEVMIANADLQNRLWDMNMFYVDSVDTFFGAPTVSDGFLPYVANYFHEQDLLSDTLLEGFLIANQMTIDGTDPSVIYDFVVNDLTSRYTTSAEREVASLFADIYMNSYQYNWAAVANDPFFPNQSERERTWWGIALDDAAGGISGGAAGAFLGSFFGPGPGSLIGGLVGGVIGAAAASISSAMSTIVQPQDSVELGGFTYYPTGQAFLDIAHGNLVVSNIGSSGDDGVNVHWEDDPEGNCPTCPRLWETEWLKLDSTGTLPLGAGFQVKAFGRVDTNNYQEIGLGAFAKLGTDWILLADFTPIGATTQTVVVYDGDSVVASVTGHTGPAVMAARPPEDWHWMVGSPSSRIQHGCTGTWKELVDITIVGERGEVTVSGDAVQMIPENDTLEIDFISRIEIRAVDIPEITFTSMSTSTGSSCNLRGDNNHDGNLDIADLTFYVAYLFLGGPAPVSFEEGDINNDGTQDIADLTFFVAYLFKGGETPPECGVKLADLSETSVDANIIYSVGDGSTEIWLESKSSLKGIEIELLAGASVVPVSLADKGIDLLYGHKDGLLTVGLVDLEGELELKPGKNLILRFEEELQVVNVIAANHNHQSFSPLINRVSKNALPQAYALHQNYPNPFNPSTEIGFALPRASNVKLTIFNLLGQTVVNLVDERLPAGNHVVSWDGGAVASGIYFYRLETDRFTATRKMLLLK